MDHAATTRRVYERINAGDIDGFGELLADGMVEHEDLPGFARDKDGVLAFFRMMVAAFPDMRINSVEPGFTKTDLNGNTGTQTVAEGAEIIVRMAQLGPDGPTGGYFDVDGPLAW